MNGIDDIRFEQFLQLKKEIRGKPSVTGGALRRTSP